MRAAPRALEKCATGIRGFDEITQGGLPRGRPTLICGGPGCGKTIFSLEFLLRGAEQYGEPGVFMSFEELADDISKNVASLGFDVDDLVQRKLMVVDHVRVERAEIEETGEYDLEGLFIRLGYAIDSIGAKRVVLDTIESLFSGFSNTAILRSELRRLFGWLKERGVTAVITGERGEGIELTRQGLEEYVSDCVVLLDNRIANGVSTRRMRVVKYRGSTHGANEYPFLIDTDGMSVLPITSLGLQHEASNERISTGIPRLDTMLGGKGLYRGTSVLVSGTAGTGKSTIAAHFADASCRRGERCVYFAFEESQNQIVRNMRTIGIDLERAVRSGMLVFHNSRPTFYGLEMHLAVMHRVISEVQPRAVVLDPISNLEQVGTIEEVKATLMRLVDFLKTQQITALFTTLTSGGSALEVTSSGVSSLMDAWILLKSLETNGERNRGLYVLKARGIPHSNQIREFLITQQGVDLIDVYTGPEGVLTGSARIAQAAKDASFEEEQRRTLESRVRAFERKRAALMAQIASLQAEIEVGAAELSQSRDSEARRVGDAEALRAKLSKARRADPRTNTDPKPPKKEARA